MPEGLINYFALLGWSPGGNQEFIRLEDMIKKFTIKAVGKTSAGFDDRKLAWVNAGHLKVLGNSDFLERFREYLDRYPCLPSGADREYAEKVVLLFKNRIQTFKQFFEMAAFCFSDNIRYDLALAGKFFTPRTQDLFKELLGSLNGLKQFEDEAALERELRSLAESKSVQAADLIHPLRFAITGGTVSPGIFELMKTLGKDRVLKRLKAAQEFRQEVKG